MNPSFGVNIFSPLDLTSRVIKNHMERSGFGGWKVRNKRCSNGQNIVIPLPHPLFFPVTKLKRPENVYSEKVCFFCFSEPLLWDKLFFHPWTLTSRAKKQTNRAKPFSVRKSFKKRCSDGPNIYFPPLSHTRAQTA